jgi:hypothetical protein
MSSVDETNEKTTEATNVIAKTDDATRTHFKVGSRKSKLAMVQTE